MKTLSIFLSLLALSCCSPDAVSPAAYQRQGVPPAVPPAADAASRVRDAAGAVDRNAAVVEAQAAAMSRETRSLREALGELSQRADVLRKKAATTEEEKAELWMRLTDITRRALLLEDQAAAAVKALDEQRELRRQAIVQITEMEVAAREKDQEAAALRMQLADEAAAAAAAHRLAEENAEAFQSAKASADKLRGARNLALWAGGISIAVAALLFWLNSLNPLAFLRS